MTFIIVGGANYGNKISKEYHYLVIRKIGSLFEFLRIFMKNVFDYINLRRVYAIIIYYPPSIWKEHVKFQKFWNGL